MNQKKAKKIRRLAKHMEGQMGRPLLKGDVRRLKRVFHKDGKPLK